MWRARITAFCDQVATLVSVDRNGDYGPPHLEAQRIQRIADELGLRPDRYPAHVPLFMVVVKLVRESHKHKADNLHDAAAYLAICELMSDDG